MPQDEIYNSLVNIVGEEFVSTRPEELYFYSRDSGAQPPRKVDYIVMPKTVDEVQKIVVLANKKEIPVTPMGGSFTTSGLAVPVKGGMVMDLKRMNKIIEVNDKSRYAVVEAGVSQGALIDYLNKHYPHLQHSTPEAPPITTVVGNALIRGHGHISPRYGIHSELINGMEVVLPTGEICKVGSCCVSPYWFTRGPLPDLPGLFIGWHGTTGIVTKLSIQLFARPKFRDIVVFYTDNVDLITEILVDITSVEMYDNIFMMAQERPDYMDHVIFAILVSGSTEQEFEVKRQTFQEMYRNRKEIEYIKELPDALYRRFIDVPPFAAVAADFRKGGGFEYTGAILPLEKVVECWKKGREIFSRHGLFFSYAHQVLGPHCVMFGFNYSFNRADESEVERVRKALDESNRLTLTLGGMVWRAELPAQEQMLAQMDPNTLELMKKIKQILDPNEIMNPGNWSVN
jgi:FAD/FMN-containing dehydrogenase